MMNKVFGGKTIQAKIMKFNFMIICVISVFLSVSAYLIANKKAVEITEHAMLHHVDTIAYQYKIAYDEMMGVVLNCAERGKFELEHLNSDSTTSVKSAALGDAKLLNDYCAIVGYGSYITKLSVFSENGALIQAGNSVGSANDAEKIMKSTWFQKELEKEIDTYRLDKEVSPFYNDANNILPIARKISVNGEKEKAWVVLCISDKLYKNILTEASNENEAFVVTHIGTRIASMHEKPEYKEENEKLAERLAHEKEKSGILSLQLHGERTMVAYHREESSGIMTVESMPYRKLSNDILLLVLTIVLMFIACLFIGVILSIIFSNQLKRPIDLLKKQLSSISKGDFTQNPEIESEDEIGTIGKGINKMAGRMDTLLHQRVKDEKEKGDLELKMLQAQINPHFLYNTLDSIKWIAVIQKNSGIVKMVTALSGLLKNMAKGFNEKVTLRQELDFLNDYITIEKVKYVELFDIVIDVADENLYSALIIKLTLQPLVENAIFSGIEPSGRVGLIRIEVSCKEGDLLIVITDNGRGIPPEKMQDILKDTEKVKGSHMSGIGLPNVERRIKLTYGEPYGMKIESKLEEYTKITIRTPLEYAKGGER